MRCEKCPANAYQSISAASPSAVSPSARRGLRAQGRPAYEPLFAIGAERLVAQSASRSRSDARSPRASRSEASCSGSGCARLPPPHLPPPPPDPRRPYRHQTPMPHNVLPFLLPLLRPPPQHTHPRRRSRARLPHCLLLALNDPNWPCDHFSLLP